MPRTPAPERGGAFEVAPQTAARIASFRGAGDALPPAARDYFEPRFGRELSSVRLHTGPQAAAAAGEVRARAFTVGSDIAFGAGEFQPESPEGRKLLAHELVHTVQQGEDRDWAMRQPQPRRRARPMTERARQVEEDRAREAAAHGLGRALGLLDAAIRAMEHGWPIPARVRFALARFFPGQTEDFLFVLQDRGRSVLERIRSVTIVSVDELADVENPAERAALEELSRSTIPAAAIPFSNPTFIGVQRSFYRQRRFQATRLIHETFHIVFDFVRHTVHGPREAPQFDAFAYQGFFSRLGGLPQHEPLVRFPAPSADGGN